MGIDGDPFSKNVQVNMAFVNFRDVSRTTPKIKIISRAPETDSEGSSNSYSSDRYKTCQGEKGGDHQASP